jgi:hypothetical protein
VLVRDVTLDELDTWHPAIVGSYRRSVPTRGAAA